MKKLIIVVAISMLSITKSFANNEVKGPEQTLRNEIATLLKSPEFTVENELMAKIEFTVNNKGEIVVLTVDADDSVVESFVKARLNYKKVDAELKPSSKIFKVDLRIKKDA